MSAILAAARQDLGALLASKPGGRFRGRYRRRRHRSRSAIGGILYVAFGAIVAVGSLVLAPLPGPGWATVLLGLGIVAGEHEASARLLDRSEMHLRRAGGRGRTLWNKSGAAGRITLLLTGVAVLVATLTVALGVKPGELMLHP